jgi:hypothetical protein
MPIDESKIEKAIKICESHGLIVNHYKTFVTVTYPDGKTGNYTHSLLIEYGKEIEYHDERKERIKR